jgi:release factor glutamine methyltransferase
MIRQVIRLLTPVLPTLYKIYFSRSRSYRYDGIKIICHPGVFYPGFIGSTKHFLDYLQKQDLEGKKFLELGSGSGIISLLASRKGAWVTASDINPLAVENTKENAKRNHLVVNVIQSDLFKNIPDKSFDFIAINPPYYAVDPKDFKEMAWFCGKEFEYFENLFPQLKDVYLPSTIILMNLSEHCNLPEIKEIAAKSGLEFHLKNQEKRIGEWNYIFQIGIRING